MKVYKKNATSDVLISSQSSTVDIGSLSYNLSLSTSGFYVAYLYGNSTVDESVYLIDSADLDIREAWSLFGGEALIMTLLFCGTMAFIGIQSSAVLGVLFLLVGLVLFWAMGFVHINMIALSGILTTGLILIGRSFKRG